MYGQFKTDGSGVHIIMAASDWNTVTSDLQRAVNNLAWFVLESMTLPEQAHFMVPLALDSLSNQSPVVPPSFQPHQLLQSPANPSPDPVNDPSTMLSPSMSFLSMPPPQLSKAVHKKKGPSKRQQKQQLKQQHQQQQQQQIQSNNDAGAALDRLVAETLV